MWLFEDKDTVLEPGEKICADSAYGIDKDVIAPHKVCVSLFLSASKHSYFYAVLKSMKDTIWNSNIISPRFVSALSIAWVT
jgi:hypothetical protein